MAGFEGKTKHVLTGSMRTRSTDSYSMHRWRMYEVETCNNLHTAEAHGTSQVSQATTPGDQPWYEQLLRIRHNEKYLRPNKTQLLRDLDLE